MVWGTAPPTLCQQPTQVQVQVLLLEVMCECVSDVAVCLSRSACAQSSPSSCQNFDCL